MAGDDCAEDFAGAQGMKGKKIPKTLLAVVMLITVALVGVPLINRILSSFDLRFTSSPPFVELSPEAFLTLELDPHTELTPAFWYDSTPAFAFYEEPNVFVRKLFPSALPTLEFPLPKFTLLIKYPRREKLRLFRLHIEFWYGSAKKGWATDSLSLHCQNLPQLPLELEDQRVEIGCELRGWGSEAKFMPLSEKELQRVMHTLPGWGKNWLIMESAIVVSYTTSAKDRAELHIPIKVFRPASFQKCPPGVLEKIKEMERKIKTKNDAKKLLGEPWKVEKYELLGVTFESIIYRCSDLDSSDLPTCLVTFSFNPRGKRAGSRYVPFDEKEGGAAIQNFERLLSQIENQEDARNKLGEPYLRISNEWYYRLPEAPEHVLFGLRFSFRGKKLKGTRTFKRVIWFQPRLPCP